jgi:hypothetical protein
MGNEDPIEDVVEQQQPVVPGDDEPVDESELDVSIPLEADPADVAEDIEDLIVSVPPEAPPPEADPADVAEQWRSAAEADLDPDE